MAVYSFHMYDRDCAPIFAHHWRRPSHKLSPGDLDKLVFGVVFSLRNVIRKLAPADNQEDHRQFPSAINDGSSVDGESNGAAQDSTAFVADDDSIPRGRDSFFSFTTAGYSMHVFESPSSVRLILVTSPSVATAAGQINTASTAGSPAGGGSFVPIFNLGNKPGLMTANALLTPLTHPGGDARTLNWQVVLKQIYQSLYCDYIVKNPFTAPELFALGGMFDSEGEYPEPHVEPIVHDVAETVSQLEEVALEDTTRSQAPEKTNSAETIAYPGDIKRTLEYITQVHDAPTVTDALAEGRRVLRAEMKASRKAGTAVPAQQARADAFDVRPMIRWYGDSRLVNNDLFRMALDRFVQSLPAF
ncbi:Trafficking protein particle complex subunit BET5 [Savitreella phatthalungensis]